MKWRVEFDLDEGVWLRSSKTTMTLQMNGYAVGGFRNEKTGVKTYTLHRMSHKPDESAYPIIFETTDLDELNRYINLILPQEG